MKTGLIQEEVQAKTQDQHKKQKGAKKNKNCAVQKMVAEKGSMAGVTEAVLGDKRV